MLVLDDLISNHLVEGSSPPLLRAAHVLCFYRALPVPTHRSYQVNQCPAWWHPRRWPPSLICMLRWRPRRRRRLDGSEMRCSLDSSRLQEEVSSWVYVTEVVVVIVLSLLFEYVSNRASLGASTFSADPRENQREARGGGEDYFGADDGYSLPGNHDPWVHRPVCLHM